MSSCDGDGGLATFLNVEPQLRPHNLDISPHRPLCAKPLSGPWLVRTFDCILDNFVGDAY